MDKIPVSVVIVTRNEEPRLRKCLDALGDFSDIHVIDSGSADGTRAVAESSGAKIADFSWNGRYPKKRQWCLDNLDLAYDFVFFVDADEILTPALCNEIRRLDWSCAGYFVKGGYVFEGKPLQYGLRNNKLALFNRQKMEFPVLNDLDIPGMGEIEGHYQPVLKAAFRGARIGQLSESLLHEAHGDAEGWEKRHRRYAQWEAAMDRRRAWPSDPSPTRRLLKRLFKAIPFRPWIAFTHSYILKRGFLDGARGLRFAISRARYYRMIAHARRNPERGGAAPTPGTA
ncbi:MAG: glycosyltransferase family 2 protein [Alphaproteobacteria bacterium]|nr:glycosyltransferase family 2 protein [Alphaproteobacteria bacterium]